MAERQTAVFFLYSLGWGPPGSRTPAVGGDMTRMTDAYEWHGRDLVDQQGDKVGTIEEL